MICLDFKAAKRTASCVFHCIQEGIREEKDFAHLVPYKCQALLFSLTDKTCELDNPIDSLRDHETCEAEDEQSCCDTPKPGEVTLVLLSRHPHVHAPETRDDIHG